MSKEEINKLFRRIELDESIDSCGFEFADGLSSTFDNVATCYDDRLKLYKLVKHLQQRVDKASELLVKFCNENQPYLDEIEDYCKTKIDSVLEILKGDNND